MRQDLCQGVLTALRRLCWISLLCLRTTPDCVVLPHTMFLLRYVPCASV
jgi:hypothetical protein